MKHIMSLLQFRLSVPLDAELYGSAYTHIRRCKIMVFMRCLEGKISNLCNVATNIEEGIYSSSDKDSYEFRCFQIASMIDPNSDGYVPELVSRLSSDVKFSNSIGKMSPSELDPDHYSKYIETLNKRKSFVPEVKASSLYKCYKCGHLKCVISNLYNRSADESINQLVRCVNCGHQWTA